MPFDVRRSGYERDVVQINDLPSRLACHVLLGIPENEGGMIYLQLQFEFWLKENQLIILKRSFWKHTLRFFGTVESIVSWCIVRNTLLKDIVVLWGRGILTKSVLHFESEDPSVFDCLVNSKGKRDSVREAGQECKSVSGRRIHFT